MRFLLLCLILSSQLRATEPIFEVQTLFEAGKEGYAFYRIPSLVCTEKGTLLAFCEARKSSASDWGQTDILYRRCTNGRRIWSVPKRIETGANFEKNPVALKGKIGKSGEITTNNPLVIADGKIIHFLYCIEYMRCFYCRSEDDGVSFSAPVEITATFEKFRPRYDWKVIATGPGHGIRHSRTGRLVVPVWLSLGTGGSGHRPSVVVTIYSDDQGKTWQQGEIVAGETDLINPSEMAIVELADGRVMLNIRHESTTKLRATSLSFDGATKWSKPQFDQQLPEPVCMGSLIRFDRSHILFSNPHNTDGRERRNVSIHFSEDDGKSWSKRRSIESGLSGYSDLAVDGKGMAYCLFERGERTKSLALATFNEAWIKAKPYRIVTLGDSITKGYRNGVPEEVTFPALIQNALRQSGKQVEVINVGVGSETTVLALKRLKKAVVDQQPDLVTIMYGANDSYIDPGKKAARVPLEDYAANLRTMTKELQNAGIQVILMTTNRYGPGHPVDGSGQHPNLQMDLYMKQCRDLARELKIPLVDHQQHWIDAEKGDTNLETWMTDHIHPNALGHEEIARLLLATLKLPGGK